MTRNGTIATQLGHPMPRSVRVLEFPYRQISGEATLKIVGYEEDWQVLLQLADSVQMSTQVSREDAEAIIRALELHDNWESA